MNQTYNIQISDVNLQTRLFFQIDMHTYLDNQLLFTK